MFAKLFLNSPGPGKSRSLILYFLWEKGTWFETLVVLSGEKTSVAKVFLYFAVIYLYLNLVETYRLKVCLV